MSELSNFFSLVLNSNKVFTLDSNVEEIVASDIKLLISAAQLAPYIGTEQGVHLIVINDREIIKKIAQISEEFVRNSSVIIISLANINIPVSMVNSLIATYQTYLMALSMNKATIIVGSFVEEEIKKILNYPEVYKMTSMIVIGKIADVKPMTRKTERMAYLASLNTYGQKITDFLEE